MVTHFNRSLLILGIVAVLFLTFNFIDAAWTGPTATAPGNNIPAPINVGTASQDKAGVLGLNGLAVFGQARIVADFPLLKFQDTNALDYWLITGSNLFYIFADRDNDDVWASDGEAPMTIGVTTDPAGSGDFARFSNQVRANTYCDRNGGNCFSAASVSGGGGPTEIIPLAYTGTRSVNTGIPSTALCAVTGVDNGGCDGGARCKIGISGSSWQVDQRQGNDCNATMACEYSCSVPTGSVTTTYSWQSSAFACNAPTPYNCDTTSGRNVRTVTCVNQFGTVVADSFCTATKPATDGGACSKTHYDGTCR